MAGDGVLIKANGRCGKGLEVCVCAYKAKTWFTVDGKQTRRKERVVGFDCWVFGCSDEKKWFLLLASRED